MNQVSAQFIRKLRGKENQIPFAKKLGVSQARLSQLENGKVGLSLHVGYLLVNNCNVEPKKVFDIYKKSLKEKKNVRK